MGVVLGKLFDHHQDMIYHNAGGGKTSIEHPDDPDMPALEDIVYSDDDEYVGADADMNNLNAFMPLKGIVIRNKERLVAQGYTQEEGIDYDEVFAPIARIEAIRLFLAYVSFNDFVVYQMDVKSDFLYGKIEEKVYVCQPPGFEDPDFPDRVYKVEKALYELHQAPRAWYETLSTYLLDNEFQRGKIDKTLFIKRYKGDILLMSSMGELTFFLGLQVKQKKNGIFVSQDKYVDEILKKFGFIEVKTASTPMEPQKPMFKDEAGKEVDVHIYRLMIGSLMYLTSSRPDIMFSVCACARYQVNLKVSHLHVVKMIFRYIKGQPKLGLWYPKDSPLVLIAYTESDYAGASLDMKSTTGGKVKKSVRLMMDKLIGMEFNSGLLLWPKLSIGKYIFMQLHALVDGKKIIISEASVRRYLKLEDEEGTRTDSSHSSASSNSTTPLSPDHPLTHVSPTPTQPVLYFTKRYWGMSELILDIDSEGDEWRDEDIEEDENLDADDEREREPTNHYMVRSQWLIIVYTDIPFYLPVAPFRTRYLLIVGGSGSLPISPSFPVVPSPIASSMANQTTTISVDEDQFLEARAGIGRHEQGYVDAELVGRYVMGIV
ncbi:putative ribonuclease H-like domain-containing protein [Tanacetum coccineum]